VERAKGRLTVHEVVKRDDGSFALFVNRKLHAETRSAMTNERIKLDPLVNQLVRFKLHELAETKNGVIRAFDEQGCPEHLPGQAHALNIGSVDSAERPELKTLEDRAALVEVWWLSPGPFRAADRFPLGNSANPPFGFPRSDTNRNH